MVIDFDEKEKFVSQRKQCLLAKLRNHMLHHISLGLSALSAQRPFFDAVLKPLGYTRVWSDFEGAAYTHAVG